MEDVWSLCKRSSIVFFSFLLLSPCFRLIFDTISNRLKMILYYSVNVCCECKIDTKTFTDIFWLNQHHITRFSKIKNAQCRITSSIVNIPFKYTYCVIYCTYTFCIFLCSLVVRPLFIEFFGVRSDFTFWFSHGSLTVRSWLPRPVSDLFKNNFRPLADIGR